MSAPVRVGLVFGVLEHLVSGDIGRISGDVKLLLVQPVRHVVVFAAPTPEHVGEAVNLEQVARVKFGTNTT